MNNNETIEIGNPISEEELESKKMAEHIHKHVKEIRNEMDIDFFESANADTVDTQKEK